MIIAKDFRHFVVGDVPIKYVSQFKYLGHIVCNSAADDMDIDREIKSMFVRVNMLIRKFSHCTLNVKKILFKTYCLCVYDIALWSNYYKKSMSKFRSCYNKCLKLFFGFKKYDSVTEMLFTIGLTSFDTIVINNTIRFKNQLNNCRSPLIKACISFKTLIHD